MHLVCFSHLRWNFVYQRPQHLLSRFTTYYKVIYIEEAVYTDQKDGYIKMQSKEGVMIVIPQLQNSYNGLQNTKERMECILETVFIDESINKYIFWFYTPMALLFTSHFKPRLIIYDCMDELSAFKFAPPELKLLEDDLFEKADIVFTGGYTLFLSKKRKHKNIFCFPSSIEKEHFIKARYPQQEPDDQVHIPHPRLGFYGVLDERFDIDLIKEAALAKPSWQFILIGPVVKIDPASLPVTDNIHYMGSKKYDELPAYLNSWDIALIPFALNESTRYISPTKTPEYLAAGVPVISTAINDVVNPYGEKKLVHIIQSSSDLVEAATAELNIKDKTNWLKQVDQFLNGNSWNNTWHEIHESINKTLREKDLTTTKRKIYV